MKKLAALLLLFSSPAFAQNPSVAQTGGSGSGTGNQNVLLAGAVALHDTLIVCAGGGASATITSASDNATGGTNTYSNALTLNDGGSNGQIRCDYAADAKAASADTLTVTCNISSQDGHCVVFDAQNVTNTTPLDQKTTNHSSGTSPTVTSGTTTAATELVVGYCFDWFNNNTYTKNASYTLGAESHNASGGDSSSSEYRVVTSTGTQTPTYSLASSSSDWIMAVMTFKGANQAAGGSKMIPIVAGIPRIVQWASIDTRNGESVRRSWRAPRPPQLTISITFVVPGDRRTVKAFRSGVQVWARLKYSTSQVRPKSAWDVRQGRKI